MTTPNSDRFQRARSIDIHMMVEVANQRSAYDENVSETIRCGQSRAIELHIAPTGPRARLCVLHRSYYVAAVANREQAYD